MPTLWLAEEFSVGKIGSESDVEQHLLLQGSECGVESLQQCQSRSHFDCCHTAISPQLVF